MILTGPLDQQPGTVTVELTLDTSDFERQLNRIVQQTLVLDITTELIRLSPDGAWARFYVRGAMDPDFATPDAVDHYLRALAQVAGALGHAARTGFLAGWAEHRGAGEAPLLAWHRLLGDRAVSVGYAA